jgi:hypothetical protein
MIRYEELGVDQLLCYVQFGHLSHESVLRTIELLGTEVIPELRRREVEVRGRTVPVGAVGGDGAAAGVSA